MGDKYGKGLSALLVDDEPTVSHILKTVLSDDGFEVATAVDVASAMAEISKSHFDLYLLDNNLPDGTGLQLAQSVLEKSDDCEILIITAYATLESAIDFMRLKVADYLVKPFDSLDEVSLRISRVVEGLKVRRKRMDAVEQLRQKNKELEAMAMRDPLTGLFNHAYLQERLAKEISRSGRYRHELSLMFIDVDNFKSINDSLGHMAGDQVLKSISQILLGKSRDMDYHFRLRDHDIAARYGGDEFVLVLPETPKGGAAITAERLRACVESHQFERAPVVTLSIGLASFPDDGNDKDSLVNAADLALYAAKNSGRNRVISFSSTLSTSTCEDEPEQAVDLQQLTGLQRSMDDMSFEFVYQPLVEAKSRRIIGYEALCRPTDSAFADPVELLSTAARTGRVSELGRHLREQAMAPAKDLPADCLLFINLHPHELNDPSLLEIKLPKGLSKERLVLEVTRSREIADQSRLRKTLKKLHASGYKVALDDLCVGYLGLNALSRLEPDFAKISMQLIRATKKDRRTDLLIRHYLEFCAREETLVIAERVETEEDRELILSLGCPLAQGHLFSAGGPPFVKL